MTLLCNEIGTTVPHNCGRASLETPPERAPAVGRGGGSGQGLPGTWDVGATHSPVTPEVDGNRERGDGGLSSISFSFFSPPHDEARLNGSEEVGVLHHGTENAVENQQPSV